jgi:hypothetical protein
MSRFSRKQMLLSCVMAGMLRPCLAIVFIGRSTRVVTCQVAGSGDGCLVMAMPAVRAAACSLLLANC